jgi:hypothetical protein
MHRPNTIVLPTILATVIAGLAIWLIAGPPPHGAKPVNAHPFVVSIK